MQRRDRPTLPERNFTQHQVWLDRAAIDCQRSPRHHCGRQPLRLRCQRTREDDQRSQVGRFLADRRNDMLFGRSRVSIPQRQGRQLNLCGHERRVCPYRRQESTSRCAVVSQAKRNDPFDIIRRRGVGGSGNGTATAHSRLDQVAARQREFGL
jgi:hypothetical protein